MKSVTAPALRLGLALLVSALCVRATLADGAGNVTNVTLGKTIERTWDQVKADNYAYAPKQDFNAATGETHVYLPYGSDASLYAEVKGAVSDAGKDGLAKFHSTDGSTNAVLTYKLHFDKPIGGFRYVASWTEFGVEPDAVGGVEYSVDGTTWKTMKETKKNGIVNDFANGFKADGLKTDTLYIRYYTRDPKNPDAGGAGRWLQFWMSGDPNWGDASSTFFARQLQVFVTPAK
jgi:hypothetical protein